LRFLENLERASVSLLILRFKYGALESDHLTEEMPINPVIALFVLENVIT